LINPVASLCGVAENAGLGNEGPISSWKCRAGKCRTKFVENAAVENAGTVLNDNYIIII